MSWTVGSKDANYHMEHTDPSLMDIESAVDPPEIPKVHAFFVTVVGGFEDIALREIKAQLTGVSDLTVEKRARRGRIHFTYRQSPKKLLGLKNVEGVYASLKRFGGITTGRPGLIRIAEVVSSVDLTPGIVLYNILHGEPEVSGVAVNCTVGRGHRFTSSELHQLIRYALAETYDLDETEQNGPYYLQVRVEGKQGVVGLRLSERGEARPRQCLSIPTIRCLGDWIKPEAGSIWLDAVCQDGALTRTWADVYGIRPVAIDTELSVFDRGGPEAIWGGARLPFADDSVDGVFANLSRRREIRPDERLGRELSRVLTHHGRVVLMMDRNRDFEATCSSGTIPFRCSERKSVQFSGDDLVLYHLRRAK